MADSRESTGPCVVGDGRGHAPGEWVRCSVCDRPACDYHGDYPSDEAYAEGDWRCPDHMPVEAVA